MTWTQRGKASKTGSIDDVRQRVFDGLHPTLTTVQTLAYDGFIPRWAIFFNRKVSVPADWARRT